MQRESIFIGVNRLRPFRLSIGRANARLGIKDERSSLEFVRDSIRELIRGMK